MDYRYTLKVDLDGDIVDEQGINYYDVLDSGAVKCTKGKYYWCYDIPATIADDIKDLPEFMACTYKYSRFYHCFSSDDFKLLVRLAFFWNCGYIDDNVKNRRIKNLSAARTVFKNIEWDSCYDYLVSKSKWKEIKYLEKSIQFYK